MDDGDGLRDSDVEGGQHIKAEIPTEDDESEFGSPRDLLCIFSDHEDPQHVKEEEPAEVEESLVANAKIEEELTQKEEVKQEVVKRMRINVKSRPAWDQGPAPIKRKKDRSIKIVKKERNIEILKRSLTLMDDVARDWLEAQYVSYTSFKAENVLPPRSLFNDILSEGINKGMLNEAQKMDGIRSHIRRVISSKQQE